MDLYTLGEVAYKNGYDKGYEDAKMKYGFHAQNTPSKSVEYTSKRCAKREMLKEEFVNWGYNDWYSDTIDVFTVIANELSWRMAMRILHKLRRKRGAEQ